MMERDDVLGVEERQVKVLGHETTGEILAAAHELLGGVLAFAAFIGERRKLIANGVAEAELIGNVKVTLTDVLEQIVARNMVLDVRVYQIEQVGNLGVALKTAAAGRNDHKTTRRIGVDNGLDLFEMLGIGDRRATELGDLNHDVEVTFLDVPRTVCRPL